MTRLAPTASCPCCWAKSSDIYLQKYSSGAIRKIRTQFTTAVRFSEKKIDAEKNIGMYFLAIKGQIRLTAHFLKL